MAQITNRAQLSYNNTVINSNEAVGEIVEVLTATKNAVDPDYSRDGQVTYAVSLINSGTTAINGATVTDNLGAYDFGGNTVYPLSYVPASARVFVNGVLQTVSPTVTEGPPLVISDINVPASSNVMVIYEAEVTRFAPPGAGSSITNTATVDAAGITPFDITAEVDTAEEPELAITKSMVPSVVTEGEPITYEFLIQNYGNTDADAGDNVSVRDTFDPILTNITVSLDGRTLTEGTEYNYDPTTGVFSTVPGAITVPAATFTQDATTGEYVSDPGASTLTVTGTI